MRKQDPVSCSGTSIRGMPSWKIIQEKKSQWIDIQYPAKDFLENYWLVIGFDGDRAEIWMDGELCGDWFYTGNDWQIGLKYFDWPKQMTIRIYPVREQVYVEKKPEQRCGIRKLHVQTEYRISLGTLE